MGIFNRSKKSNVIVNKTFRNQDILISIFKEDSQLHIPIQSQLSLSELRYISNLDTLQLLEDLWMDEKLVESPEGYLLSYDDVYRLDEAERSLLNLPAEESNIEVLVDNESFVGSEKFKITPKLQMDETPNLHIIGNRTGPIIELPTNELLLVQEDIWPLLRTIDNAPESRSEDILPYVAKVRHEAKALGVPLSEHLERENYEFIDKVDVQLERNEDSIVLTPTYDHQEVPNETLTELYQSKSNYKAVDGKRLFVDREARKIADQVRQIDPIRGGDIPKFVQNPDPFIPESISLDNFGERVKDLGIRVYKAQPYIHAKQTERGWFDFESGFHLRDDEGNTISKENEDYFSGRNESGDFKQLDFNTFVAVPDQVGDFRRLSKQVKEDAKNNPSKQVKTTSYILEIFENLNNVEYNQPIEELRNTIKDEGIFDAKPPANFNAQLKPFQEEGFVWMKTLRATGYGGLLADDMGLGKTIQVIAYLTHLKELKQLTPTLIVLPKTLIENWKNEMGKFSKDLTAKLYTHLGSDRSRNPDIISNFDIVLTTYQTLVRDQLILAQVEWQMVICDEAQHIKNPTTSASIVVKALKNKGRLALTGTPVENSLSELWSIVDFVQPGLLGSLKEFKRDFEPKRGDEVSYYRIQKEIESKIKYIYKRRTKTDELADQLPEKFENEPCKVPLGREQKKLYEKIISSVQEKEIETIEGLMRLKMICSHPGLYDRSLKDIKIKNVPKLSKTLEYLKDIQNRNEKVLIFTEYREMQAILKQMIIRELNINPAIINGSTSSRQHIVDSFNKLEGFDVLILSPKAAGTGLTITGANHVIHYTRWWNPAVENQATDRVYRIGQEKEVYVYYPIASADNNGTSVEEVLHNLLEEKKKLAQNVIVPSKEEDFKREVLAKIGLSN